MFAMCLKGFVWWWWWVGGEVTIHGTYVRDDKSEMSFITIQLYLNKGFKGGNTTFLMARLRKDGQGKMLE